MPIKDSMEILPNVYTTGELDNMEQSLIINIGKGPVVLVGCAHPGLKIIKENAEQYGEIYALIGGFHHFDEIDLLETIQMICPTHCTKRKSDIIDHYPDNCINGGVGTVIEI